MSERAPIELEGVGKGYRLYRRSADRLRELVFRQTLHQTHWALRDVGFSVAAGETFGLVGENGAGKSTLLKLVAGTSNPSTGRVRVRGRVAALLELGAGFHPEQDARENVYLMGALAGIGPGEMPAYYASVAAFSELPQEALERPVKTYSSGMFVRLAFAAATAVEPDILIIDEALSVGDMHFQKKSLDRIMEFRDRGKTVLFCSHNLYQIRSLCSRAAWIHQGRVERIGVTEEVVTAYESYEREKEGRPLGQGDAAPFRPTSGSTAPARIRGIVIQDGTGRPVDRFKSFEDISVVIEVEPRNADIRFHVGMAIVRNDKENVFGTSTHFQCPDRPLTSDTTRAVRLRLPAIPLLSGDYWLSVYVLDDTGLQVYDMAEKAYPFTVHNPGRVFGMVNMPHEWVL